VAYSFVAGQFGLLAVLLLWHPPHRWVLPASVLTAVWLVGVLGAVWLALGLVSLGRSLTALPLPVVHGELRTGGLYRLSRHPIYTGLLALAWSSAVRAEAPGPLLLAAALTALLWVKSAFEERHLRSAYPGYDGYARRVPRFLPFGRRLRPARSAMGPKL